LSCTAACFNHIGQADGHVSAAIAIFNFNIISTTKSKIPKNGSCNGIHNQVLL